MYVFAKKNFNIYKTLEGIGGADSFVDYILQHSYDFETMPMILRSVFTRLREANLQMPINKSKLRYSLADK